jgi:hypothetical protein
VLYLRILVVVMARMVDMNWLEEDGLVVVMLLHETI